MISFLSGWLRALAGTGLVCALALALCPQGRVRRALRLVCGAAMAVALLSPAVSFDLDAYASALARYAGAAQAVAGDAQAEAERRQRSIIEASCAAYIWDKADALGVPLAAVSVRAEWHTEGYWVPWSCAVAADGDARALAAAIEAELGIPPARQSWEEAP